MWKLVPARGDPYRLLIDTEYVVGRKNSAILIRDDPSISRNHATLTVSHSATNLSQATEVPVLSLKDASKYGTFVNGEKMQHTIPRTLKTGDRVTFGVFSSKFRVEYEPLIACSSCIDGPGKADLNKAILQLGGCIVNSWTEKCTHLVMMSVKVTIKTICALICGRPIVKPEYFTEFLKAIQSKKPLPKPESFYPPVDEPVINTENLDLSERTERKQIFRGKTFVFLNAKQHRKLSSAIVLGGGEVKLLTEETTDNSFLLNPGTCVVEVGITNSQVVFPLSHGKWIDSILNVLQRQQRRAISEAEIGLAVIFMSTESYCNPQIHTTAGLRPGIPRPGFSGVSQSLLVEETLTPGATMNVTAYVADTESEQADTCMDSSDKQDETLKIKSKGKMQSQDASTVKETPNTTWVNAGLKSQKMSRLDNQESQLLPPKLNKMRNVQQQTISIKDYFQSIIKKRQRDEQQEMPASKSAKTEELTSSLLAQTQPTPASPCSSRESQLFQKGPLTSEPKSRDSLSRLSVEHDIEKPTAAGSLPEAESALKKRKKPDDLALEADILQAVESFEHDWEGEMEKQESGANIKKKRRLDVKENNIPEDKEIIQKNDGVSEENELEKTDEIKKESPERVTEQQNNNEKLQDDSETLPKKLLLTEFRSLVVSHTRARNSSAVKSDYGHLNNFKKFKKVAYPGVGKLPHIIGGSDLIAHHARKNAELEEWLRQEMEIQSQHAKEESLADDLFRYNPNGKKRR
ncbi:nibrin [Tachyglossus aculeatus]|uniref:nibrin n=1 Tax=Tachyglossus aculeatus TaxID=9261 RepID=UPI0018F641B3|nr:nibrin [Tachyglossus aculeatus]